MTTINDVVIEGIIVHKFVTPKIVILTINTGNATVEPNYPKVLFFGQFIEEIEKGFEVKDHVQITGNIQSSKYKPNIKNQNTISIFGESITRSDFINSKTFTNKFEILGTITSIEKIVHNIVKMKVLTTKHDRISFVSLVYYTDNPDQILEQFKVEDTVHINGCIQTTKKESNGEIHHFENYVINTIEHADTDVEQTNND